MIIYSVTVSIRRTIESDWKEWMVANHIPDVMATGFFEHYEMLQLLDPIVDPEAVTYSIQYRCRSMQDYERYQAEAAPRLQEEHTMKFKDQFAAFRTILRKEE